MQIRSATVEDAEILGAAGQLIRDEGHRNAMTIPQLVQRMADWLRAEYEAAIAEERRTLVGYALFRREVDYVYLRQIFVRAENRRPRHRAKPDSMALAKRLAGCPCASALMCSWGMKRVAVFGSRSGFRSIA